MPRRVLYVETAPQAGGSTVSLFELLRSVDRAAIQPVVLLCASNPFAACFAELGAPVIRSGLHCSARAAGYAPALARARTSSWAQLLKRHPFTLRLWRAAGLAVRTVSQTWPRARDMQRIIESQRIDLVHLNDAPELHKAGILGSRLAGVPCLCHVRSMPPVDVVDRLLARRVRHFVFISAAVEQDQRRKGLGRAPGSVIYNGVDTAPYAVLPGKAEARARLGVAPDDTVLGLMARIEPWKGQRDLLAALAILRSRTPHLLRLRCLIAGEPELDGGWYLEELKQRTVELGLGDVVRFVGRQSPPAFHAALDVLIHTSVQPEPFGRVLIEGMAAGLPIVATNNGGVPEIVLDEQTGLLVPPGNPGALAAAVERLLGDEALRRRLGEAGRRRAGDVFSLRRHVAAIQALYETILTPTRSAS